MRTSRRWNRLAPLAALAALTLTLAALAVADNPKADPKADDTARWGEALRNPALYSSKTGLARVRHGKSVYGVFFIEFESDKDAADFNIDGVHKVRPAFKRFVDVLIPVDENGLVDADVARAFDRVKGIRAIDRGTLVVPPPPTLMKVVPITGRGSQEIVRGGVGDYDGKGVLIAVLDSGIDFRHPDFVEADGKTSRLLYFWDTLRPYEEGKGRAAPVTYPDKTSIGTIFSQKDLSDDLAGGKAVLGTFDEDGHGTACAGLAAGNGRQDKRYKGVAPGATLIGVRLGHSDPENEFLLAAVLEWLDGIAREKKMPLVVTCSFGGQHGDRDGSLVQERHISARFPETAAGRLLCIAAGNEGDAQIHARTRFDDKQKGLLSWDVATETVMTICVDGIRPDDLKVRLLPETAGKVARKRAHPLTGSTELLVRVARGRGAVELTVAGAVKAQLSADAYFPQYNKEPTRFLTGAENAWQVSSPATAPSAIAVGSYDFNDEFEYKGKTIPVPNLRTEKPLTLGDISDYSNAGSLRIQSHLDHKLVKPDLAAPGRYHTAPAPARGNDLILGPERYQLFWGTSAATPYAAGVCALLLQKKPTLTTSELREFLEKHATKDKQTGDLPNPQWGRGKLDLAAVKAMLDAVK